MQPSKQDALLVLPACKSAHPADLYVLLTQKPKDIEKRKLLRTFPTTIVTGVPIFSAEGRSSQLEIKITENSL